MSDFNVSADEARAHAAVAPSDAKGKVDRAEFEVWARRVGYEVDTFTAEGETTYSATFANVAWEAWQAALSKGKADAANAGGMSDSEILLIARDTFLHEDQDVIRFVRAIESRLKSPATSAQPADELDHGETVLRVQEALGITRTGWVSPDVIMLRIEQLQKASAQPDRDPVQIDPVQIVREAVRQLAESAQRKDSSYVEGMVVGANMCLVRLERVMGGASPASQPVAPAVPSNASVKDMLRWLGVDTDYHGKIAFTLDQFARFVDMLRAAVASSDATGKADAANAGDFSIRGPLTDAQRDECRYLYNNLKHLQAGGYYVADDVIRAAAVYGYTNGYKDFHDPATSAADADVLVDKPLYSTRQKAARYEWLRAWYLRDGRRAEINPNGHIQIATPEMVDAAIDAHLAAAAKGDAP